MFVGLAITGVVSYRASENLQFQFRLLTSPWLGWGIFIIQIVVVVALSGRGSRKGSHFEPTSSFGTTKMR